MLRTKGHREKVTVISGVMLDGQLFIECHRDDPSGTEVIWILEQLLEGNRGPIVVIWDNIRIHRSAAVATFFS